MNDDKFLKDVFDRVNLPEFDINKNVMNKINNREHKTTRYKELFAGISLSVFLVISTGMVMAKLLRAMDFFSSSTKAIASSNTSSSTNSLNYNTHMLQLKAIMDDVNKNSERNDR